MYPELHGINNQDIWRKPSLKSGLNIQFRCLSALPFCTGMKGQSRNSSQTVCKTEKLNQNIKTKTIKVNITYMSFVSALLLTSVWGKNCPFTCIYLISRPYLCILVLTWSDTSLLCRWFITEQICGRQQWVSPSLNYAPPVGKCPLCWSVIEQVTESLLTLRPCSCSWMLTLTPVDRDGCFHNLAVLTWSSLHTLYDNSRGIRARSGHS